MTGPISDPTGLDEATAPPRDNGELVFTAPWQSRMFATTMALREREILDWEDFRQGLIAQIAEHSNTLTDPAEYDYWGCWQRALEARLHASDVITGSDLDRTAARLEARPHGHDHSHDHSHDDGQDQHRQ